MPEGNYDLTATGAPTAFRWCCGDVLPVRPGVGRKRLWSVRVSNEVRADSAAAWIRASDDV